MKKFLAKLKTKNFKMLASVGFLVVASFAVAGIVYAAAATIDVDVSKLKTGTIGNFVLTVLGGIFNIFIWFEGWVITILARIMLGLMTYNGFVTSYAVTVGWTVVRDISNLFFVLIVLAIAIGTILHIESYNFKKLLPKVLIMAILVNFSRTICGLMIDFAQVVMMTFAVGFASIAGAGQLMNTLHITEMTSGGNQLNFVKEQGTGYIGVVITGLLAVILLAIAIIVIVVILAVIVMRMIMLWLLVVLSPLAYIFAAFPQGQRYSQQWWTEFGKYVIVGPVLAFFLWLSFTVASAGFVKNVTTTTADGKPSTAVATTVLGQVPSAETLPGEPSKPPAGQGPHDTANDVFSLIGNVDNFMSFILGIGMLLGGLMITSQLGVAGGAFAGQMSSQIRSGKIPFLGAGAKKGLGYLNRKIYSGEVPGIGKYTKGWNLSPLHYYGEFKKHMATRELEQEAKGKGAAGAKFLEDMKPDKSKLRRAFGIARLMSGSSQDALKYYGNLRGINNLWQAVGVGKGPKALLAKQQKIKDQEEAVARAEVLIDVRDKSDYGKDVMAEEIAERMFQSYKEGDLGKTYKVEQEKGKAAEAVQLKQADIDEMLARADDNFLLKHQIKDVTLNPGEDTTRGAGKQTGILPDKANVESFMKQYFTFQAKKLFDETGQLVKVDGGLEKTTAKDFEDAGDRYFEKQIQKKKDDADRVVHDYTSDQQLNNRQRELEVINRQILDVLRKASRTKDGEIGQKDKDELKLLRDRGEELGGTLNTNFAYDKYGHKAMGAGVDFSHFSIDDEGKKTIELAPQERTEKETKELQENKFFEKNRADTVELEAMKKMASMSVQERKDAIAAKKEKMKIAQETLRKMKTQMAATAAPSPYYAMQEYRGLENTEMHKLPDEMEWDEIETLLRRAIADKDTVRVTTLMKKAAKDGNDNEYLKAWGYSSDAKGQKDFGNDVLVKQMGMNQQQMLQTMSDIGYINEGIGHYETARMVGLDNGIYNWRTPAQQAAATSNENLKKNSRSFLQNTNRLGYGGEQADGKFKISLSGQLTLGALEGELINRISRGEFNQSALGKIAEDQETLNTMVKKGLFKQATVDAIYKAAAKQSVSPNFGALLKRGEFLEK